MLYTVHTDFTARDPETGHLRRMCRTVKIDAANKDFAKYAAWQQILDSGEYMFLTFEGQNARASRRK